MVLSPPNAFSSICSIVILILVFCPLQSLGSETSGSPSDICMVLVTSSTGGTVYPEGAVTVIRGSDFFMTITPEPGYQIDNLIINGNSTDPVPALHISPVLTDMTVHAQFSRQIQPVSSGGKINGPPVSSEQALSNDPPERSHSCPGDSGCSPVREIQVGPGEDEYQTIQEGVSQASPGDTIRIRPGVYREQVTIYSSVSLIGDSDGLRYPVISAPAGNAITIVADNVTLMNLSLTGVQGSEDSDTPVIRVNESSGLLISNCIIADAMNGLQISGSTNGTIRDSTVRNLSKTGIILSSSDQISVQRSSIEDSQIGIRGDNLKELKISDNLISSQNQTGLLLSGGIRDARITGNVLSGNGHSGPGIPPPETGGLILSYADNCTVADNTLNNNGGTALVIDEVIQTTIRNNTHLGNYAGFSCTGNLADPRNLIAPSNTIDGLPLVYHEGETGLLIEGTAPSTLYLLNCSDTTVSGLTMNSRNGYGIMVKGGSNISVVNCSVGENVFQNILFASVHRGSVIGSGILNGSGVGLGLTDVSDMVVSSNQIHKNSVGIGIRGNTTGIDISMVNLSENVVGFRIEDSTSQSGFGNFSRNLITGGTTGISSSAGGSGKIIGNQLTGMHEGVHLTGSHGLILEENQIDVLNAGVRISSLIKRDQVSSEPSFGNIFTRNHIAASLPIDLNDSKGGVFGNSFALNDFIAGPAEGTNSTSSVLPDFLYWGGVSLSRSESPEPDSSGNSSGSNNWDTGSSVRYSYGNSSFSNNLGNYWSEYNGTELGASGIGSRPYQINEDNTDRYPLISSSDRYLMGGSAYYLDLQYGWNFISTPSELVLGADTARLFSGIDTAGHSLYTFWNESWVAVKEDDHILPLTGYWIYTANRTQVPLICDPGTVPSPVHLLSGWNAIGFPAIQPASAHEALSSLDLTWSYVVGYNATMQAYEDPIIQENGGAGTMYPARGYWIFMNQDWDLQPITG